MANSEKIKKLIEEVREESSVAGAVYRPEAL